MTDEHAATLLAPLEAKARALRAQKDAAHRNTVLQEAAAAIFADAALRETEGECSLAEYGRELARLVEGLADTAAGPGREAGEPQQDGRPRCPHCQMPHDPTPSAVLACQSIRASIAADEAQQPECSASRSGDCLREAESETACDTEAGECVHGGKPGSETQQDETQAFTVQVWPLARVLAEARCGSEDWTWDEEWADLDRRHAESGYLAKLEQDIRTNGITMPVLIGTDGRIRDGHHRLRIAVRAGIGYVPVEVPAAVSQPGKEA